jgi:hypothetical protein
VSGTAFRKGVPTEDVVKRLGEIVAAIENGAEVELKETATLRLASKRIAELESHNLGLANESVALQEKVAALEAHLKTAVVGLTAITNLVKHMRDALSEGEQLNARMAFRLSKDPEYLKDLAAKALMKIYGGE